MSTLDDQLVEITLSLVTAYGAFLLADRLHGSGVIAAVMVDPLIGGHDTRMAMSASSRDRRPRLPHAGRGPTILTADAERVRRRQVLLAARRLAAARKRAPGDDTRAGRISGPRVAGQGARDRRCVRGRRARGRGRCRRVPVSFADEDEVRAGAATIARRSPLAVERQEAHTVGACAPTRLATR